MVTTIACEWNMRCSCRTCSRTSTSSKEIMSAFIQPDVSVVGTCDSEEGRGGEGKGGEGRGGEGRGVNVNSS